MAPKIKKLSKASKSHLTKEDAEMILSLARDLVSLSYILALTKYPRLASFVNSLTDPENSAEKGSGNLL